MLSNEEITRETYNKVALEYTNHTKTNQTNIRQILDSDIERVLKLINKPFSNKNVFLPGAGDARDAIIFEKNGFETTCIDYSLQMKEIAVKNGYSSNSYVVNDIRHENIIKKYNLVWASTSMYHINKNDFQKTVLPSFLNCLIEDKILYLNLFLGSGEFLEEMPKSYEQSGPRFYAYYTEDEIYNLLKCTGFTLIETNISEIFDKKFIRIISKIK